MSTPHGHFERDPSGRISNVPILILYPHNRCNCRCLMCDIWKMDEVQEISAHDLERHFRDIEALEVTWVVFSGGEPLMHSDLFRLCDLLRARRIRTTLLSSGLLLAKHAESIADRVDDLIVSLDGPPEVHDAIRGIPRAYALLAEGVRLIHARSPGYPIAARSTVQKANVGRLRDTASTAKSLGLDSISFLAADLTSSAFNRPAGWPLGRQEQLAPNREEIDRLEEEIESLCRDPLVKSGFILESPDKLRRLVLHFKAQLQLEEPVSPRCNAPWVSAVVESDGTVRPCFFHDPIGNVSESSLQEALNSPAAREFRRSLDISAHPVCRRCVCSLYLP